MTTTWDGAHKASCIALSSGDLQALNNSSGAIVSGKVLSTVAGAVGQYFEIQCDYVSPTGSAGFGSAIGLANLFTDLARGFDDTYSVGWYSSGWIFGPGFSFNCGVTFTSGDQLGIEWNSGGIKFYKGATLAYTYTGTLPTGDLYAAAYLVTSPDQMTA